MPTLLLVDTNRFAVDAATPEPVKYTTFPALPLGAGPVAPVDPIVPCGPVAPVDPIVPVAPVAPVDPIVPVAPVAPVDPIVPVAPVAPVDPIVPVAPVAPTKLIKFDKSPPSP